MSTGSAVCERRMSPSWHSAARNARADEGRFARARRWSVPRRARPMLPPDDLDGAARRARRLHRRRRARPARADRPDGARRGDLAGVARAVRAARDRRDAATAAGHAGAAVPAGRAGRRGARRARRSPRSRSTPPRAAGLVAASGGSVRAARGRPALRREAGAPAPWWVVSDFGSGRPPGPLRRDHVLGIGAASLTLAQATARPGRPGARPRYRLRRAGAAPGRARRAASSATDVSDRALRLAATTAALSGQDWDLRRGSLLEPVAGERFDLVVANPPFVVSAGASGGYDYRDSGLAGDAVERASWCAALPGVLAPGGTARAARELDRDGRRAVGGAGNGLGRRQRVRCLGLAARGRRPGRVRRALAARRRRASRARRAGRARYDALAGLVRRVRDRRRRHGPGDAVAADSTQPRR